MLRQFETIIIALHVLFNHLINRMNCTFKRIPSDQIVFSRISLHSAVVELIELQNFVIVNVLISNII